MIVECPGCKSRYDVSGRPANTQARCRCGTLFALPEPPRDAGRLGCPQCGASVSPMSHRCEFCDAALLVKACPRCFARIFHGHEHCTQCGVQVDVPAGVGLHGEAEPRTCPRCESSQALVARLVGDILLDECSQCHGVWLDSNAVARIVEERRDTTARAVLSMGVAEQRPVVASASEANRMYVKCPDCSMIMNRVNFARRSGVIVDVCRAHGTWFDHSELPAIVRFVSQGGLAEAERRDLEELKRQAQEERRKAAAARPGSGTVGIVGTHDDRSVSSFSDLLASVAWLLID